MAIDSEPKRWAMHAFASGIGRNTVFNPDTSGLSAIERATVLRHNGTIAWGSPAGFSAYWARFTTQVTGPAGMGPTNHA